jgi:signal peptidase I
MASGSSVGVFVGVSLFLLSIPLVIFMLRDSARPIPKRGCWLPLLVIVLGVGVSNIERSLIRSIAQPYRIPSSSMEPTLRPGDRLMVARHPYWFASPQRGDIVAFRTEVFLSDFRPDVDCFLKRIVGLPGEEISIQDGRIIADGKTIRSSFHFASKEYAPSPYGFYLTEEGESLQIPEGYYFVIGDNVDNSFDGRTFGPIPRESIFGKVSSIWWPPERIGPVD